MLVQILPDQVGHYWPQIRKAVEDGMREFGSQELKEMLSAVLSGKLTVWISGNGEGVNGVVLTCVGLDDVSGRKSFVIYFAFRFGEASGGDWFRGLDTLKKAAKWLNCYRVVAYTESLEVVKLCEALGGKMREYVIEFPIEELYEKEV